MAASKAFELDDVLAVSITIDLDQPLVGPSVGGGPTGDGLLLNDGASYLLLNDDSFLLING
jgi:hypothetical protein